MLRRLIVPLAIVFPLCAAAQSELSLDDRVAGLTVSRNAQDAALQSPFQDLARGVQPKKDGVWFKPLQKLGLRKTDKERTPHIQKVTTIVEPAAEADGWMSRLFKKDSADKSPRFRPFAKLRRHGKDSGGSATQFTLGDTGTGALLETDAATGRSFSAFLGLELGGITLEESDGRGANALSLLEDEPKRNWPGGTAPAAAYGPTSRGLGIDDDSESRPMQPLGINLRF